MNEVEVKVIDIDVPALEKRLLELGAHKSFEGDINASLLDFPDRRLNRQKSILRLRSRGDMVELTFKRRVQDAIALSTIETEVKVSDFDTCLEILKNLGLSETVRGRRKHRISYSLEDAHFEFDTIEGIPTYLEIEVNDSALIPGWMEKLGLPMASAKAWRTREIYDHYGVEYPTIDV